MKTESIPYYASNEFCKHINCDQLALRLNDQEHSCLDCKAYQFHDYVQLKADRAAADLDLVDKILTTVTTGICNCDTCQTIKRQTWERANGKASNE